MMMMMMMRRNVVASLVAKASHMRLRVGAGSVRESRQRYRHYRHQCRARKDASEHVCASCHFAIVVGENLGSG